MKFLTSGRNLFGSAVGLAIVSAEMDFNTFKLDNGKVKDGIPLRNNNNILTGGSSHRGGFQGIPELN